VFAPILSGFAGIRQIIELASPQAELLFHFRFERYGDEQATPLGLFTETLSVHGGTSSSVLRPRGHNGYQAVSFAYARLPQILSVMFYPTQVSRSLRLPANRFGFSTISHRWEAVAILLSIDSDRHRIRALDTRIARRTAEIFDQQPSYRRTLSTFDAYLYRFGRIMSGGC
jgi:hypothetical protein